MSVADSLRLISAIHYARRANYIKLQRSVVTMGYRQATIGEGVTRLYASFEEDTAAFRSDAACSKGCAYSCSDAGRIDITTMEGLIIRNAIGWMPPGFCKPTWRVNQSPKRLWLLASPTVLSLTR